MRDVIFSTKTVRNAIFLMVAIFFFVEAYLTFSRSPLLTPWDFQAFWGAGQALNLGLNPYNFSDLLKISVNAPFVSPLFLAEMFQPLAHFPLMTAKMIWTGLSFIEAAATLYIIFYVSKTKLTFQSLILGFALLMAFEPFSGTIFLGQTDILVVFALALSWLCLEQRRLFLSGLVFCIGATNPHLITGIGLYYLYRSIWRREYKLLLGILTGGAILLAGCLIYLSYSKEWLTTILPATENGEVKDISQVTVVQVFASFLGNIPQAANYYLVLASIVTFILILIASVFSIMIWSRSGGRCVSLDIAVAVVLTLIATPFAYHQDFLICELMAPSLLVLLQSSVSVNKVAFLFLSASTFFFSSMTGFINAGTNEFRLPFYYFAPFLFIVMVLIQIKTMHTFRQYLPWLIVFALLSLVGSYFPQIFGIPIIQYETVGIFIGLSIFMGGMWLWHPALQPSSASTFDDTKYGSAALQGALPKDMG